MTAAPGESNYIIGGIVEDKGAEGRNVNQWHWTEKDITPWAKQHTAHLLTNLVIADQPTLHIATTGVYGKGTVTTAPTRKPLLTNTLRQPRHTTDLRSFEGEVTLNVRKKKLIPLYELKFAVGWEAKQLDDQGTEMFRAEGQIEVCACVGVCVSCGCSLMGNCVLGDKHTTHTQPTHTTLVPWFSSFLVFKIVLPQRRYHT